MQIICTNLKSESGNRCGVVYSICSLSRSAGLQEMKAKESCRKEGISLQRCFRFSQMHSDFEGHIESLDKASRIDTQRWLYMLPGTREKICHHRPKILDLF